MQSLINLLTLILVVLSLYHSNGAVCEYKTNMMLRSAKTCAEIENEIASDVNDNREVIYTSYDTCIIKDTSLCKGNSFTFFDAAQKCADNGLRVCERTEVEEVYDEIGSDCRGRYNYIWTSDYEGMSSGTRRAGYLGTNPSPPNYGGILITRDRTGIHCCADIAATSKRWCKSCKTPNSIRTYMNTGNAFQCDCQRGFTATYSSNSNSNGKPIACTDSRSGMNSCPAGKYAVATDKTCTELSSSFHSLDSGLCVSVNQTWVGDSCKSQRSNTYGDAASLCHEVGTRLPSLSEVNENKNVIRSLIKGCTATPYVLTHTKCEDGKYTAQNIYNRRRICVSPDQPLNKLQTVCVAHTSSTRQCLDVPDHATSTAGSTTYQCLEGYSKGSKWLGSCANTHKPTNSPTTYPTFAPSTQRPTFSCGANQFKVDRSALPRDQITNGQVRNSAGNRKVFAYQPLVNGQCPGLKTYNQAKNLCESNGARLCTLAEVQKSEAKLRNVGRDVGCGNNVKAVWTSSPCCSKPGTCGNQKNWALMGNGGGGRVPSCEASGGTNKKDVRCCVDAVPEYKVRNFCADCPANSESTGNGDISSCSCMTGYWGRNGGECYANV